MPIEIDPKIVDTDYVKNGTLYQGLKPVENVVGDSAGDLPGIAKYYEPGAFAHTAGWGSIWELATDGKTWEPV